MKQSIKEDFRNFQSPKGTHISVYGEEILIRSRNTNYYTIGFYLFLLLAVLAISIASSQPLVLFLFGFPLVAASVLNLCSKVFIVLREKEIEIKDGFFSRHVVALNTIKQITFGGITKKYSSRISSNSATVSNVCTHIFYTSGTKLDVFKNAQNQKFMFRCISHFVEEMKG